MSEKKNVGCYKVVLLCQNKIGLKTYVQCCQICIRLTKTLKRERFRERLFFDSRLDGLIALSGDVGGDIGKLIALGNYDEAKVRLNNWNNCLIATTLSSQ